MEKLLKSREDLQQQCLRYMNLVKNIAKHMKQVKLFSPKETKDEESSPASKRAKAIANLRKPVGVPLPAVLTAPRESPSTLGGQHDHARASQMCLAVTGTQYDVATTIQDGSLKSLQVTADEFVEALKATALKEGNTLNASAPEHQRAFEIFTQMGMAYYTALKLTPRTNSTWSSPGTRPRTPP